METNRLFEEILGKPQEDTPKVEIVVPESSGETRTRANHCTALEKSTRVDEVADMLLNYKSNKEIKEFMVNKYGLSPETIRNYLTDANRLIQEQVPEIKSIISKNIDTYSRIIRDSESEDKRTTILAMAGLEKLLRLQGPEVQNNTQINLQFDSVDTEELIELIRSLTPSQGK